MKVSIRDHNGKYGSTWDGPNLKFDRDSVGPGEVFEMTDLDPKPVVPEPPVVPQPPTLPPYATYAGTSRDWFQMLVYGKPFGQQTLLECEPTLNANGWQLTPPNANGERTKVLPPREQWTRVGFGEGYWVWVPQGV